MAKPNQKLSDMSDDDVDDEARKATGTKGRAGQDKNAMSPEAKDKMNENYTPRGRSRPKSVHSTNSKGPELTPNYKPLAKPVGYGQEIPPKKPQEDLKGKNYREYGEEDTRDGFGEGSPQMPQRGDPGFRQLAEPGQAQMPMPMDTIMAEIAKAIVLGGGVPGQAMGMPQMPAPTGAQQNGMGFLQALQGLRGGR